MSQERQKYWAPDKPNFGSVTELRASLAWDLIMQFVASGDSHHIRGLASHAFDIVDNYIDMAEKRGEIRLPKETK